MYRGVRISDDTPRRVSGPFGARECGSTKWTPLLFLGRKQTPLPGFAPRLRPPTPPTTRPPTPTSATLRMAAEVGSILVPNRSHRRCNIRPASCSFQQLARPRRAGRHHPRPSTRSSAMLLTLRRRSTCRTCPACSALPQPRPRCRLARRSRRLHRRTHRCRACVQALRHCMRFRQAQPLPTSSCTPPARLGSSRPSSSARCD